MRQALHLFGQLVEILVETGIKTEKFLEKSNILIAKKHGDGKDFGVQNLQVPITVISFIVKG